MEGNEICYRLQEITISSNSNRSPRSGKERHLEVVEHLGSTPLGVGVQHLQQLARELEGRRLEVDAPGGVGQHEAEVDVDEVSHIVQQDVAWKPMAQGSDNMEDTTLVWETTHPINVALCVAFLVQGSGMHSFREGNVCRGMPVLSPADI